MKAMNNFRSHQIIIYFVIVLVSIFLIYLTFKFFYEQKETLIKSNKNLLITISSLKAQQIDEVLNDNEKLIKAIAHSYIFYESYLEYLKNKSLSKKNELYNNLVKLRDNYNYSDLILTDNDGNLILSSRGLKNLHPEIKKFIQIYKETQSSCGDYIFRDEQTDDIFIVFLGAIKKDDKNYGLIIGLKDVRKEILPILKVQAFDSDTYESFLIKRENDSVLYINDLKFKPNTAMKFKLPISTKDLPASKALKGNIGLIEGIDYRGKEVLTFASKINKTNWVLISKIDKDEFLSGPFVFFSFFYVSLVILIFISFILILVVRAYQRKSDYKKLYETESLLKSSIEKFKVTIDSLSEGVITTDINGKIDYMNRMAEDLTGWRLREAKGRNLEEVYKIKSEITGEWELNPAQKVLKQGIVKGLANHTILISATGKEIAVMDTGAPIYNERGEIIGVVVVFQDESERRNFEKALIESEARLMNILENLIEGCQIISYDWRYMYLNKEAVRQSKKERKDLLGKQIWDCYPGIERTHLFSRMLKCMNERTIEIFENEFIYPDGSRGYFIVSIQPVDEGILILTRDVTEFKIAQLKIEEGEKRFLEIAKNLSETIFIINPEDYSITFVNDSINLLCSITAKDVLLSGKKFYELMEVENQEEYKKEFLKGIEIGENFIIESIVNTKDGRKRYIKQRFTILKDSKDKISNIICLAYDVTEELELQKELIKREQLLSAIYDSVQEVIALIELSTRQIIFVNQKVEEILGFKQEEVIGSNTFKFFPDENSYNEFGKKIQDTISRGEKSISGKIQLRRRDGELIWAEYSYIFLEKDGVVKNGVLTIRDITKMEKMIEELIRAKEIAEEANRIKDGFISAMSHEIRTPLNVIMGFANLLRESIIERLSKEEIEYFNGLLRGADRLLRTGTMILDGSRLDAKDLVIELKPVPLNMFVESIANKYEEVAKSKNLNFVVSLSEESIMVLGDEYALNVIIDNVVENAIKFSRRGNIEIKTEIVREKSVARVVVKDEGVGVSEEFLKFIGQKFSQEEVGSRRQFEGLGLGLYVTKKFLDLCGGELKMESEKDKGTTVYIYFKLAEMSSKKDDENGTKRL